MIKRFKSDLKYLEDYGSFDQAMEDQYEILNQKCEGWSGYIESLLNEELAYYNQLVGTPIEEITESSSKNSLQDVYLYSSYISSKACKRAFIIYDPEQNKMYKKSDMIRKIPEHQR